MKRTTPPFRADHVGSYLRTAAITEARAKRDKGLISAADLKTVEDQEIPKVIKKQEEVGLQCTTDGEYRRMFWHYDFYDGLDNVEIYEHDHGIQFQGVQTKPLSIKVTKKIEQQIRKRHNKHKARKHTEASASKRRRQEANL